MFAVKKDNFAPLRRIAVQVWLPFFALLLAVAFAPCGQAADMPYTLELSFHRVDKASLRLLPAPPTVTPGKGPETEGLLLAVKVVPLNSGVYLYASASQTQGKATEISIFTQEGPLSGGYAVFPRGKEKPNPLQPGAVTSFYEGSFTVVVPVSMPQLISGGEVRVEVRGLACSPMNCTPLTLATGIAAPGESAKFLPMAVDALWWGESVTGVAENMVLEPGLYSEPPEHLGAGSIGEQGTLGADSIGEQGTLGADSIGEQGTLGGAVDISGDGGPGHPLVIGGPGLGDLSPIPVGTSFTLEKITPVPFSPSLEVASLGKAVILGFFAGIILNLMPCVLPVIGIKLSAFLRLGSASPAAVHRFRRHQVFFALGILVWFSSIAVIFHWFDLAWGQIFQLPAVVVVLAILVLLLALNMFGVLSLPLFDFKASKSKNPDAQAFASGFAATLLATPCGGPLLGGVLSWAFMQPLGVMALTLESVGLGMAFPYILLACFPSLVSRFPRPGAWMEVMEHVLGFLLLATVAYLVSFLPSDAIPRVTAALVLAAFGGWVWGQAHKVERPPTRILVRLCGGACVFLACAWALMPRSDTVEWTEYSPKSFGSVFGERVVLVDFTADWCPTCKVVESTALADANLRTWREKYNLALFRVDLTRENPDGAALLRAVGSVSIPVIAIFRPGAGAYSPLILRDVVSKGQIEKALARATTDK